MKTRKMLRVKVISRDGRFFLNPLMLSEARLISQLAQNSSKLEVTCVDVEESEFKRTFGL